MITNDDIIKEEIDAILVDIKKAYNSSGRKVTGEFEKGLEAIYEPNKGTIRGFTYLAGRGPTKKKGKSGDPTVLKQIKKWIVDKGIAAKVISEEKPATEKAKRNLLSGLAFIITRKIHEQGTNKENWLRIYEEVITVSRISRIIDRVSELNVNQIVLGIRAELEIIEKNV